MALGGRISVVVVVVVIAVAAVAALALLAAPAFAAFPGTNGKIAAYGYAGSQVDVFTLEPSGANLTNLTHTQQSAEYDPVWSSDGKRIAFADVGDGRIWVMNADGSDRRAITTDLAGEFGRDVDPAWSPDGRQIVFSRSLGDCTFCGDGRLFVVRLDGSPPRRLTNGSSEEVEPSWSPDGSEIAFSRREGCVNFRCVLNVYAIAPDGGGERQVTNNGEANQNVNWSPDGRRLTLSSTLDACCVGEIYVMDRDGSDMTKLTSPSDGFIISVEPAWSPDGSRIVFIRYAAGTCGSFECPGHEVFSIRPDGTDIRQLTDNNMREGEPDWQPLNSAPECSAVSATPGTLLPANHKLVTVSLDGATDPDGDPVSLEIQSVTQDEPVTSGGDSTSPDASAGAQPDRVNLRAERNPKGDGRVYTIAFTVSDGRGGSCSGTARVSAPRHKDDPAVDSAPPSFDSFGSVGA